MFSLKLKSLEFLFDESLRTAKRFPAVLVAAVAATVWAIYAAETKAEFEAIKPVFICLLGIPLFLALTLLLEAKKIQRLWPQLLVFTAGALFLATYHYFSAGDTAENYALKYVQLSLALHLLVSFAAYIGSPDEGGFWELNKAFFIRILTSFVYAAVFFLGLVAAILTTSTLFSFEVQDVRYTELFFFSAMTLQTWHFLAGVSRDLAKSGAAPYPQTLKYFIQYLLIPLVSLYTLILYVYMLKILITNTWPEGYVGWLVSIMSVLGILNLLLIHPEKFKPENKWLLTYTKYYYILILPLLGMLFIAIGKRISEYGITERRYFLLALGLWLFLIAVYFTFSRAKKIKVIPVSLFFVALITLWGPLSAYRVSLHSQMDRARDILERNHIPADGILPPARAEVSREDQVSLSSVFDYVLKNHGTKPLRVWFSEEQLQPLQPAGKSVNTTNGKPLMVSLGLTYYRSSENNERFYYNTKSDGRPLTVTGYNYILRLNNTAETDLQGRKIKFALDAQNNSLDVSESGNTVSRLDLNPLLDQLQTHQEKDSDLPPELMRIEQTAGPVPFTVFLDHVAGTHEDKRTLRNISGWILFR